MPDRRSLRHAAPMTYTLIVANVVVFALTALAGATDAVFARWGLVPARLLASLGAAELLTLVTSTFLHAGVLHLAGNMIFLGVFGRMAEDRLGTRRFAALYAASALGAALLQVATDPASLVPMIGASGAISGVLAAAVLLAPRERIWLVSPLTLFIPVTLRLWTFGAAWLGLQLVGAFAAPSAGGIAFWAHVGGFVVGAAWLLSGRARPQRARRRTRRPHASPVGHGPAPGPGYRTFLVTDARGRTYVFHEAAPAR